MCASIILFQVIIKPKFYSSLIHLIWHLFEILQISDVYNRLKPRGFKPIVYFHWSIFEPNLSSCCLNSHYHPDSDPQIRQCPGEECLNNEEGAIAKEKTFNYPVGSDLFYKYRHRHCDPVEDEATGDILRKSTKECGTNFELSEFELCPSWLEWEAWGDCESKDLVETPTANDPNSTYVTFERKRVRNCNTGNLDDCLTTGAAVYKADYINRSLSDLIYSSSRRFKFRHSPLKAFAASLVNQGFRNFLIF